jgi:hypothetical protein
MKRVLVVFANPKGTDPLRLSAEDRTIRECIALSTHRSSLRVDFRHAATIHDIRRAFLEQSYYLIHFSGHGTGQGLALEDESGAMRIVPQEALADFLAAYSPPLEAMMLNACYSEPQGRLVSAGVPYTIAMDGPISDPAAIEFTRGFYDALGAGKEIESAFEEACRTIKLAGLQEGTTPILLKSPQRELEAFFRACFPQLAKQTSQGVPLWLEGVIREVFEQAVETARFSADGRLTARHLLMPILQVDNGVVKEVISRLNGDPVRILEELSGLVERSSKPAAAVEPTLSVQEIVMRLDKLYSRHEAEHLDDGNILQVALNLEATSVTMEELLSDLRCDRAAFVRAITDARASQASTPRRKREVSK